MSRILVADDSRFQLHLLASYLMGDGHQVTTAQDALQASMIAFRELPELVLLDIMMPGGSGFEVMKRLKGSTKTSHIPVVIVSGNEMDPEHIKKLGAAGFLHKPIAADLLCRTIRQILGTVTRHASTSS